MSINSDIILTVDTANTSSPSSAEPVNIPSVGDTALADLADDLDRMKPFSPEDSSDSLPSSLPQVQPPRIVHLELVQDNRINLDNFISKESSISIYSPQNYDYLALPPGYVAHSPLGLPTTFPSILLPQGHTGPHYFYSPQGHSTLLPGSYIPPRNDYMLPPSLGLSSSMSSVDPQGSLFPGLPGCDTTASVPSAQATPYPSRAPSLASTSFIGRSCTPIEEEEEELTSVEPQGGLFPHCDISASVPSAQAGPYPSHTPSFLSTSFFGRSCAPIEEGEE
ncbi:hypothetical protein EV702DRAFT_1050390 [Suillus placidus]|uniref:Uncharacterized protein n=1 Tax=Suillus placidus TaxID=48579 RepID=A0A9P7CXU1_9AGAM|nr:hypothetical protein EV702DRAFT_1050390 [Suillus placidus]